MSLILAIAQLCATYGTASLAQHSNEIQGACQRYYFECLTKKNKNIHSQFEAKQAQVILACGMERSFSWEGKK